jgi:uncharacterized protein YbjT (DUF2867 family)
MIPTDLRVQDVAAYQDAVGEAITSALASSSIRYVVHLSSAGAERESGTGPVAGLHRQEERFNQLKNVLVLHLRPTYFMENFLMNIPLIKNMGINGSAIRGDLPMPLVATSDIAEAATRSLLSLDFPERKMQMLLGPRDYTFTEATQILGEAIGKPDLTYIQFGYADMKQALVSAGISESVADSFVELQKALNEGLLTGYSRDAENTTPTTLKSFASVFAAAYAKS